MGKLGARELNVSSDIDLIYVYEDDGDDRRRRRPISAHEYFAQVARSLYALIGDITEDGFVFRVDLALRPNGNSGPPVVSLAMLEEYLQVQGREWERFAWLKSRVVAPRASVAERPARWRCASLVTPFVFRRYLDYGVFEGLRQLHRQDPRRGAAPRRRPARARQRRQAVARRHPRDRVHRAAAAGGARRPVPGDPHPLDAEGADSASPRGGLMKPADRRARWPTAYALPAPRRAPHPVPRRPADARAADATTTTCAWIAASLGSAASRRLRAARPARRGARVRRHRVRRAAARRPRAARRQRRLPQLRPRRRCRSTAEAFLDALPPALAERVRPLVRAARRSGCCATRASCAWRRLVHARRRRRVRRRQRCTPAGGAALRRLDRAAAAARELPRAAGRAARGAGAAAAPARPGALADALPDAASRA